MIAKIIPFTRLPYFGVTRGEKKELAFFDYLVPEILQDKIKFGQLVQVPFRNKKVQGLIIGLKKTSKGKNLKEIRKIFTEEGLINKDQLALFKWLSSFYFASLPTIFKTTLPQPVKSKNVAKIHDSRLPKPTWDTSENKLEGIDGQGEKQQYLDLKISKDSLSKIKKNINFVEYSQRKKFLLVWQSYFEKVALYYFLIKKTLRKGQKVLILVPEIEEARLLLKYISKLSSKIFLLHSSLKKSELWKNWQMIVEDQAEVIIGTRIAVFAPIKKLGLIILENEENDLYKSEQFPYYDTRDIAWKISKAGKIKLIFSSIAPRVKTYYYAFSEDKFLPLELKKESSSATSVAKAMEVEKATEDKAHNKKTFLINMNQEMRQGNFSPLSDRLEEELLRNVKNGKGVILYLKRKGYASFVFCQDCGRIFNCPRCDLSLRTHKKNPSFVEASGGKKVFWLVCHHCGYNEEIPLKCPSCGGTEIKIKGMAVEKIGEILSQRHELFKNKIRVIDQETKHEFHNNEIIITTLPFWRDFSEKWSKNIGFVGIISADVMLSQPDYQSFERTFQELIAITNWTNTFKIDLLVQSWSTDNYAINDAVNNNFTDFYNQEIEARKDFSYPPFTRFFRLTIKEINWNKLNKITQSFEKTLSFFHNKNFKISPYFAPPRRKQMFEKNFLLKVKNLHPVAPLPDDIKKILPQNSFLDPN